MVTRGSGFGSRVSCFFSPSKWLEYTCAHVYSNHLEGLKKQLTREPKPLPRVTIADKPFDELQFEDIELHDYDYHPFIRFPVAV